jgi:hypothetical protein
MAALTGLVDRIKRLGLAKRTQCPATGVPYACSLTDAGQRVGTAIHAEVTVALSHLLAPLHRLSTNGSAPEWPQCSQRAERSRSGSHADAATDSHGLCFGLRPFLSDFVEQRTSGGAPRPRAPTYPHSRTFARSACPRRSTQRTTASRSPSLVRTATVKPSSRRSLSACSLITVCVRTPGSRRGRHSESNPVEHDIHDVLPPPVRRPSPHRAGPEGPLPGHRPHQRPALAEAKRSMNSPAKGGVARSDKGHEMTSFVGLASGPRGGARVSGR